MQKRLYYSCFKLNVQLQQQYESIKKLKIQNTQQMRILLMLLVLLCKNKKKVIQFKKIMDQNTDNLNWVSVINFLQKQYTKSTVRQKQWMFERQSLLDKINRLEGQLNANRIMTDDLLKRIKLLQVALLDARTLTKSNNSTRCKSPSKDEGDRKQVESLIQKYNLEEKVKMKGHDEFLKKIMTQMKIDSKTLNIPNKRENVGLSSPINKIQTKDQTLTHFKQTGKVVAHLDGIRKIIANQNKNYIVTVSQDCLVKMWSYKSVIENKYEHLQPTCTFRQHTGPLFTITEGKDPYNPQNSIFFTGGNEGVIKYWKTKNQQFQKSTIPIGIINSESENEEDTGIIWDLALKNNLLLSSSSDGFIRLYKVKNLVQSGEDWFKSKFRQKQFNSTSICWLSPETFLSGCSNAPRAHLWDINGKLCQKYMYEIEKSKDAQLFQINQILYNPTLKQIVSGCEDGNLRIFSHGNTKITRKIETGNSVNSISFRKEWQLVAGMQNGCIGIWDIRNYKKIYQGIESHLCKFDEGVFSILSDGQKILTGGADGIIKIYK